MISLSTKGIEFKDKVQSICVESLRSDGIGILQVNLGNRCNMVCKHCHVEAGPGGNRIMERDTIEAVLAVLAEDRIGTLDITGGSPEMNPHFRYLVTEARKIGCHVVARTNLTIFFEERMESLPEFYCDNAVEVIASLLYSGKNDVDMVRGNRTFQKSIQAMKRLNGLGYADGYSGRKLNLVYNPPGSFLPPVQKILEDEYRRELGTRFGVSFDKLYTFVNMPIGRFKDYLIRNDRFEKYMEMLRAAFNPDTLHSLMCRHLISVAWNGILSDCDFNQAMGLTLSSDCPRHISEFNYARLSGRTINASDHCYGCTAGQGST